MGRGSYPARFLGRPNISGLNVISDGLAVVVGILAIGIVLAMWLAKGAIGSWLCHLPSFQISLLDWAHRRGKPRADTSADLMAHPFEGRHDLIESWRDGFSALQIPTSYQGPRGRLRRLTDGTPRTMAR
jgi:hypothetical protein